MVKNKGGQRNHRRSGREAKEPGPGKKSKPKTGAKKLRKYCCLEKKGIKKICRRRKERDMNGHRT